MSKEKTRNNNQWTESRFNSFVTSALRSAMRRWPPKWECLHEAFVGIKKNKKSGRDAKHYLCATCCGEFPSTQIQVDHIDPIGYNTTWDDFVNRLFCEKDNLQVLCKACHKEKTAFEAAERKQNKNIKDE